MIRVEAPADAAGRWALEVLVDLARLLPVVDAAADVVALGVLEDGGGEAMSALAAPGFEVTDGRVGVPRSLLTTVVDVAGAAVEQASDERDRHDRVPAGANPLVAAGLERTPAVHEAALALREAVRRAAGRRAVRLVAPWPDDRRWAAVLTHDLDVVALWPLFTGLRLVELVAKGQVGQAVRAAGAAAAHLARNPVWVGAGELLALEAPPLRATWFVLCGTPTASTFRRGDLTYAPESRRARRIVEAMAAAGHEIALHGSFATFTSAPTFAEQRRRLGAIAGREVTGVRQHFLRMRPGATQAAMREAGFAYDATFGFSDRNGFRLGVADVVPAWSARDGRGVADFDLLPLAWMDRALSKYQGIERPAAWVDDALSLAGRVKAVQGVWTGLWHPNLIPALGYPGAPGEWARLVRTLSADGAWIATAREVVEWRRARRAAVVRRVAEDGRIELDAAAGIREEPAA